MRDPLRDKRQNAYFDFVSQYHEAKKACGDDRTAFAKTCAWAIREGYQPFACWASAAMIRANQPTHVVSFKAPVSGYICVIVGGVSLMDDLDLDKMFDPADGRPGWKLIVGEALELYQQWAVDQLAEPLAIQPEVR